MKQAHSIILVDDEPNVLTSLCLRLEAEGFKVRNYADGASVLAALTQEPADLGVFDIKMAPMDGVELLQQVRKASDMPVIFLTTKDEELDEYIGLRMGADDYIPKPFSAPLVVERIRTILRRRQPSTAGDDETGSVISRGKLTLNPVRCSCRWGSAPVDLTVTEFRILQELASRPGMVKRRDKLVEAAYDSETYVDYRNIDRHISRMKKKFAAVDPSFDVIETLREIGYRFRKD